MNDSISEEAHEAASLELLEEITARSHPIGYHVQAAIAAALQATQKPCTGAYNHPKLTVTEETMHDLSLKTKEGKPLSDYMTVTEATMVKALIPDNDDAQEILAAIADYRNFKELRRSL